jgi:hypothetical protein
MRGAAQVWDGGLCSLAVLNICRFSCDGRAGDDCPLAPSGSTLEEVKYHNAKDTINLRIAM